MDREHHPEESRAPGRSLAQRDADVRQSPLQHQERSSARQQRNVYKDRDGQYHLNEHQATVLREVGSFRTIAGSDLNKHVYGGDGAAFFADLRNLADQHLIRITPLKSATKDHYITLTKLGKQVGDLHLRRNNAQKTYSGTVKPRERKHDSAIYRLYCKEADRIVRNGGKPTRILLDFELKKDVYKELSGIDKGLSRDKQEEFRRQIAERHGLKIVNNRIQIPDLRIEYEDHERGKVKVDLEYVTRHYKSSQIRAKAAAGFRLYGDGYRGRPAEHAHDLVTEIISL